MSELERRIVTATLELRGVDKDAPLPGFTGYAAVFNRPSLDLGFIETIDPGAFTRTLAADPDVIANVQHEGGLNTIGRTRNGTLALATDETGLLVSITPPDTQAGRDAMVLVRDGYVTQMSFAFQVRADKWGKDAEGKPLRRLLDVELDGGDVAIVTGPAYPQTTVQVRAMAAALSGAGSAEAEQNTEAGGDAGAEARRAHRRRRLDIKRRE